MIRILLVTMSILCISGKGIFAQNLPLKTPVNLTASPENLTSSAQPGTQEEESVQDLPAPQVYAGEIFGVPVPLSNYYFVKYALAIFGNRDGAQPRTPQEAEDIIWDQLLLSYEAFRRNIEIPAEDVEKEVAKIIENEKVTFDRKKDQAAYENWVKEKTNEPAIAFENQIRHLLQIQKLKSAVMDGIQPQVKEAEAKQEFLDEYNTLSVELRQFDLKKEAEEFYKKVRRKPKLWDEEKKADEKAFKRPGFVSLEFLMDMWKFPKEGLYKMMKEPIGQVHPPETIYKGFGVFKILEKRVANEKEFVKVRDSYYNKIRRRKEYNGMMEWFKDLKMKSGMKVYPVIEKINQGSKSAQGSGANVAPQPASDNATAINNGKQ